jgi:hypothetical protein
VNFILDSGIYVCSPSSAPAASTSIHVLEGNFKLKIKTKWIFVHVTIAHLQ